MEDKEFNWRKEKEKLWNDWAYYDLSGVNLNKELNALDDEFIKRLKQELKVHERVNHLIIKRINKLAGPDLT